MKQGPQGGRRKWNWHPGGEMDACLGQTGRRGRMKNLLPKSLVLSKWLDKYLCWEGWGHKGNGEHLKQASPGFWVSRLESHIFGLKKRREELKSSNVQMNKAKEMRSSLHSQHVHTNLVQSGCQECDWYSMVSGPLRKPHPFVILVHIPSRAVNEVKASRWRDGRRLQSWPHASPTLVPSCLCKQGFPLRACLRRWMDGFWKSEWMWPRNC